MAQLLTPSSFRTQLIKHTEEALQDQEKSLSRLSQDGQELAQYMRETIIRGGKRTRPYLFYIAYYGLGAADKPFPWELAVAIELYHQFLLIHDDVIDHDIIRHNGYNVTGAYLQRLSSDIDDEVQRLSVSESMAILAGDLCFSMVHNLITQSVISPDIKIELIRSLHTITEKETAGQQLDVLGNFRSIEDVSKDAILAMYEYKTSAYTFELPFAWAIHLNEVDADQRQYIYSFAKLAGQAYQVTDDLVGLFSTEEDYGKVIGGDIREGKKTILSRLAFEKLSPAEWESIEELFGCEIHEKELSGLLELFRKHNIHIETRQFAQNLLSKATDKLDLININDESKSELYNILKRLGTRES